MNDRMRLAGLVALAMLAFAGNSLLNRAALAQGSISPALFAAVRLGSGALVLSVLVLARGCGVPIRTTGRAGDALALVVYVLGFSFAYRSLNAGIGALILFAAVQFTMFGGALIQGEILPPRRWLGAGLAFAGLVWLLWPGGSAPLPLEGAALMGTAGFGWGVYSLRGRTAQEPGAQDPVARTAANFVLAAPVALVVLGLTGRGEVSAAGLLLAVVSGALTSGLGYALWYRVLAGLQASVAAVAQLTVPVIAMAGGLVLLGEVPNLRVVLAALLVLGGVGWSLRPKAV